MAKPRDGRPGASSGVGEPGAHAPRGSVHWVLPGHRGLTPPAHAMLLLPAPPAPPRNPRVEASAYRAPAAHPSYRAPDSPTIRVLLSPSATPSIGVRAALASTALHPSVPGKVRPRPVHTAAL